MRTMTRGKAVAAGILALGLTLTASPAFAEPAPDATLTVVNDTFEAGSWGEGVSATLSEVPEAAENVKVGLGAASSPGSGWGIMEVEAEPQGEGVFTALLLPTTEVPSAPNADGYPVYSVGATYTLPGVEEQFWLESVQLTVTGEPSVIQGPETATISQLAGGITLQFTGFLPNTSLAGYIDRYPVWEEVGTIAATIGADGTGTAVLTVPGAQVGDEFNVSVSNEQGQFATYRVTATADPIAPTKPERIETAA